MKKLSKKIAILKEKIIHGDKTKLIEKEGKHRNELSILLDMLKTIYIDIIPKSSCKNKEANINSIADTFSYAAISYESGVAKNILKSLIFLDELLICIESNFQEPPVCTLREKLLYLYQSARNLHVFKKLNSKIIHFIWIGKMSKTQLKHVELWAKHNNDYRIMLWIDPKTLLAGELLKAKKNTLRSDRTGKQEALRIQRECWCFSQEKHGVNDEIIAEYLIKTPSKTTLNSLHKKREKAYRDFIYLKSSHNNIEIMDINNLTSKVKNRIEYDIYKLEIFYRTNLAAASDVIRLLILLEFGGIYIDIDTLPKINISFPNTERYLTNNDRLEGNHEKIEAMKNTMVFEKFWGIRSEGKKFLETNDYINRPALFNAMKKDLCNIETNSIFSGLQEIKIPFDIPLISRNNKNINVFFSNVIVANSHSMTINRALCIIKENYREITCLLEKNSQNDFISNYTLDGYKNSSRITLKISGPGVLLRAIILTIIDTLELPKDISEPALLGLINTHLSFTEQTMETETGLTSSWMK
ncbi:TcdA/TcdB catalytic glycosyltransferase domain-containing protein [Serratia sp. 2723]|uniref:TcdA/TcdB catalytic glycosyltransferase domain-containing protein n=1 Tax=unclassified Serratia (in: enterobacteria) TaxID=2647522 RepID=UPI003D1D01AF